MAHLKGTLDHFAAAMFGDGHRHPAAAVATSRSPSRRAEVDLQCFVCRGESVGDPDRPCRTCASEGWIEWGGCGMVNPRVLVACGVDPERYTRLRVRHGHRAHADVPQRRRGHARHGRGRRAVHARPSGWRSDARPAVVAARVTSTCREGVAGTRARRARSSAPASRSRPSSELGADLVRSARRRPGPAVRRRAAEERQDHPLVPGRRRSSQRPQRARAGIVCGAHNFAVGDLVVVALPGAVLPGGFAIAARKTYGHVSDGMICSARELGARRRPRRHHRAAAPTAAAQPGDDAATAARALRDDGARHRGHPRPRLLPVACAASPARPPPRSALPFRDPARPSRCPAADRRRLAGAHRRRRRLRPVRRRARSPGSTRRAPSPFWLQRRLPLAGMRPISLAVDVTNYVMLELGQPLHALRPRPAAGRDRRAPGRRRGAADDARRHGPRTLSTPRTCSSPTTPARSALAGVMGGADHRDLRRAPPTSSSRPRTSTRSRSRARRAGTGCRARRRAGSSAASTTSSQRGRRAACRGPARRARRRPADGGVTDVVDLRRRAPAIDHGRSTSRTHRRVRPTTDDEVVDARCSPSGATVDGARAPSCDRHAAVVAPRPASSRPTWSRRSPGSTATTRSRRCCPSAAAGSGLTAAQRLRRRVGLALAGAGLRRGPVATRSSARPCSTRSGCPPTTRAAERAAPGQPAVRRGAAAAHHRCCPGCSRRCAATSDAGSPTSRCSRPARSSGPSRGAPARGAAPGRRRGGRPTPSSRQLDAALPRPAACTSPPSWPATRERRRLVGAGRAASTGPTPSRRRAWSPGRARTSSCRRARDDHAPWHPGRCAAIVSAPPGGSASSGTPASCTRGSCAALGLPARTCGRRARPRPARGADAGRRGPAPRDLDTSRSPRRTSRSSWSRRCRAADVEAALRRRRRRPAGVGPAVRRLRRASRSAAGRKSLAFALRFRAPDRTLTATRRRGARRGGREAAAARRARSCAGDVGRAARHRGHSRAAGR